MKFLNITSKTLVALLASVVVFGVSIGTASAWTYGLTGSGICDTDGTFKITWVLDNTVEQQALSITASNRAVVPVGTSVPADSTQDFTENVPGVAGDTTLTVKGNFPSDQIEQERTATVTQRVPCEQPAPPVIPPQTLGTSSTPQVKAVPVGAVGAGFGGGSGSSTSAILGLTGSFMTVGLGFGLRRLKNHQA